MVETWSDGKHEWLRLERYPEGQPSWRECWVAYLDILGYRELVTAAAVSTEKPKVLDAITLGVYGVHTLANMFRDWPNDGNQLTVKVFSDSICVSEPNARFGCLRLLIAMNSMVSLLALRGLFVRGAITYGLHWSNEDVLFSPAMVEAYDMEREQAFYPRVIVSERVLEDWRAKVSEALDSQSDLLMQDLDGRFFLNYLVSTFNHTDQGQLTFDFGDFGDEMAVHRDLIAERLDRHAGDARIAAKYQWLAHYHNRFCDEYQHESPELLGLRIAL